MDGKNQFRRGKPAEALTKPPETGLTCSEGRGFVRACKGPPMNSDPGTPGDVGSWRPALRAVLFLAWFCSFAGVMAFEWARWPNGTILFGPFWIIAYNGFDDWCGVLSCVVLLPMLFAFPLKPHPLTFCLSLLALAVWLVMGMVGWGIGC
jgi:hypothetical protein